MFLFFASCGSHFDAEKDSKKDVRFDNIMKSKQLTVTLNYNSIDYYIYKGKPMGFQLELLNEFAKHMGLTLKIIIKENIAEEFKTIAQNNSDILAGNFLKTGIRSRFVQYTSPHSFSTLVLIQRREKDGLSVSKLEDLDKKIITLPSHSSYSEFLITQSFYKNFCPIFKFDRDNGVENLLEMVSNKTIEYTICEESAAKVYADYYDNLDYSIKISDTLSLSWVVHPNNTRLRDSISCWLDEFTKTVEYKKLSKKYYSNNFARVGFNSTMDNRNQKHLSAYDKTLKKVSKLYHWDWRIYGAIIYQESKFQDGLIGDGGSFGLLQVMPSTAERFGITENMSGDEQISRGAKLIRNLEQRYEKEVTDKEQLWKFIIAAFRAGIGHVDDARTIALIVGKDPNVWDHNVDSCMILKAMPKYYNLPEVKSGYHYGKQTLRYVENVWGRYLHYRNIFKP